MKATSKAAIGLLAVALFGACSWTGVFLYWHLRILGTLRTLEAQPPPIRSGSSTPSEAEVALSDAGCRGMPYIMGALDPAKNPYFLNFITARMAIDASVPGASGTIDARNVAEKWNAWVVRPDDSIEERAEKCDSLRNWWKLHGSEYHQTWRIWSRGCAAN